MAEHCTSCGWEPNEYDSQKFGGLFGRYLRDMEVEAFVSMMRGLRGSVADIGTGTGKLALELARMFHPVVAVDGSLNMIEFARAKAATGRLRVEFMISSAEHLCFVNEAFDGVVSSRLLMHVSDWKAGIGELCRIAGAMLILDFPPVFSFSGLDALFTGLKKRLFGGAKTYTVFPIREVLREIRSHDFEVLEVKKGFCLPLAFHRWLDRPEVSSRLEKLGARLGLVQLFGSPVTVKAVRKIAHRGDRGSEVGSMTHQAA